ncbi:MAG: aconitate hydratase [Candidatus Scalindua rubra]|uniref:Aconitate hydratase n=1 Tax=Candidatus Scalindua rubra TaxID=1872076 RepID=A0A1E3XBY5_9BACT|nr:MAG: aconitate hydratase [Candidatus Scalindua rubra]
MSIEICKKLYKDLEKKHQRARDTLGRDLTLTEKILYSHMKSEDIKPYIRKESNVDLYPDRVAMQDATDRYDTAALAAKYPEYLKADDDVYADPEKYFDTIIEINLSELEPQVCGPHTPDKVRPISDFRDEVARESYPDNIRFALIGSCTNSSYEDMGRAAAVARDAVAKGLKLAIPLLVTPGSNLIEDTIKRDGQMKALTDAGATVLANACGQCIGQWKRTDIKKGERNTIITSYNRNFRARNDGNVETLSFIGSP